MQYSKFEAECGNMALTHNTHVPKDSNLIFV